MRALMQGFGRQVDSIPSSGWAGFAIRRAFTEPEPDAECCSAVLARVDSMGSSDTGLPSSKRASGIFDALFEAPAGSTSPEQRASADSLAASLRAAARVAAAEAEA